MGGQQSTTRKLTVENDDPTSVIRVSEDVVERIKNRQQQEPPRVPEAPVAPQHAAVPGAAVPQFFYEQSATTVQLRRCNAEELKKNDKYWENRLQALKASHKKIDEVMEEEYNKAVKELEGNKHVTAAKTKMPPCQETKQAVLKCYQEHCNEPMKCAQTVKAFQDCVDLKRACLVANRG